MGELTISDLVRLHRIQERLDAVDDAMAATSIQAKPAIRKLLEEAYHEAGAIFSRGARGFAKHVQAGWVPGIELDEAFWNHVTAVVQANTQAADTPAPSGAAAGGPGAPAAGVGEAQPEDSSGASNLG